MHIRLLSQVFAATCLISTSPALAQETAPEISIESMRGDRVGPGLNFAGRSAVVAPNGAAATAHPLATSTALEILKAGGSAVDAAIAANAMLGLVEPVGNGMGGDLFALIWDPETEKLYGLNASGRSPLGATLADMQAEADEHMDGKEIPAYGSAPVSVPGAVDGWFMMHDKFGKTPMSEILAPAISYAENGAPIPQVISYYWQRSAERFQQVYEEGILEEFDNARETYFSPPPSEGALIKNPDLANTFRLIAEGGREAFYEGEIAETIDAYFKRIGGYLRYEDLAAHHGEWVEPLCVPYRETKVCGLPPNTQGVATLQMLQMLEAFPMREYGFGSADSLMAQIEAKRLAFEDRARGYADPAFSNVPPEAFIEPRLAAEYIEKIDISKASSLNPLGDKWKALGEEQAANNKEINALDKNINVECEGSEQCMPVLLDTLEKLTGDNISMDLNVCTDDGQNCEQKTLRDLINDAEAKLKEGDTTYLTVADKNGMMVSLIQSNYRGMGSGLVADGLGFMFQDRGQLFSLDPAHPNVFEPGKRPFHTIIPGFAFREVCEDEQTCRDAPWLSFGVMGGGMQPQGQTQIILNLVDYDMGLQEAGDAARWRHDGSCQPTDALEGGSCEASLGTVNLESGIPQSIADELRKRGHEVKYTADGGYGGYQAIMRDFEHGTWIAATELRKDGSANGY
ncbi:gamma-glutamyltransferase family protein [Ponticaulis profundi]|uniref:Gamma-glutamyltransferase family protein n=1 Tax=Ponticaulis profundi TaxID=2665222 RepID=A0ABW1SBT0_9PROT